MKKCLTLLLLFVATLSAHAQFEQGTKYVGASLSGLNLSYSSNAKFNLGLDAEAGYFIADCVMLKANVGYEHAHESDKVRVGAGARYYFRQNGIYLGAGAEYSHDPELKNDIMIPVEVGYAFYLNHYITIEPAVYYKMSLHDFGGNSTVGARIGIGYYF